MLFSLILTHQCSYFQACYTSEKRSQKPYFQAPNILLVISSFLTLSLFTLQIFIGHIVMTSYVFALSLFWCHISLAFRGSGECAFITSKLLMNSNHIQSLLNNITCVKKYLSHISHVFENKISQINNFIIYCKPKACMHCVQMCS